ncbi:MAG: hypothetical protein SLAVMIC_00101 [uncultured marine phage]|uniref:Uncharacterized protein n=1 Tax=uncultured marine phage TaxID=707152 RepID=A0A8D9FQG7_9VIRU|nr:MAG: hypothetical protein SLAVMIC_00101 [uncultured marine phage]
MIRWFKKKRKEKELRSEAQKIRDKIANFGQKELDRVELIINIFESGECDIYSEKYNKWFRIHHKPGIFYCLRNEMDFKDISETYTDDFYLENNGERLFCIYVATENYNHDIDHSENIPVDIFEIGEGDWMFRSDYLSRKREKRFKKILDK